MQSSTQKGLRFVDVHQHILYGMDDGARTQEMSVDMLHAAHHDGVRTIFVTPHATPGEVEFPLATYERRLGRLQAYADQAGLRMTLLPGAEILYTEATLRFLQRGSIPTLGWSRYVLVEFVPMVTYDALSGALRRLSNAGYIPVVAHMERYECLVRNMEHVYEIRRMGSVRLQVNCSTLIAQKGFRMKRFVKKLLAERLIDYVATDAHDVKHRPTRMQECVQALGATCSLEYIERLVTAKGLEMLL